MSTEKTDTIEKVAEAFKKHFNHFGFKKTSVDEVARELKISKKTIYQFFSSKEKIFYYIVSQVARGIRATMEKKLQKYHSERDQLEQLLKQIFAKSKTWLKKNDAFEFRYKYQIGSLAFKDAFEELLEKIIKAGMEKGEFKKAPLKLKSRFIQGVISEGMDILAKDPKQNVVKEVIEATFKILN